MVSSRHQANKKLFVNGGEIIGTQSALQLMKPNAHWIWPGWAYKTYWPLGGSMKLLSIIVLGFLAIGGSVSQASGYDDAYPQLFTIFLGNNLDPAITRQGIASLDVVRQNIAHPEAVIPTAISLIQSTCIPQVTLSSDGQRGYYVTAAVYGSLAFSFQTRCAYLFQLMNEWASQKTFTESQWAQYVIATRKWPNTLSIYFCDNYNSSTCDKAVSGGGTTSVSYAGDIVVRY